MNFEETYDHQAKLLYSLIVAGKSANFTDAALKRLLSAVTKETGDADKKVLPFDMLQKLTQEQIAVCVKQSRTGNYSKIGRAIAEILKANINLETCSPADLEKIHGIGPKTSRFFIIWCRPHERYAALDVHVLRWLARLGHNVPRSTPQSSKQYAAIETLFLQYAEHMGKTPRELDKEIWEAGAGRTQNTPLPK